MVANKLIPGSKEWRQSRIEQLRRMADGLEPIVVPTPKINPAELTERDRYNLEIAERIADRWRRYSTEKQGFVCNVCNGTGVIAVPNEEGDRRNRLIPCPDSACPVTAASLSERIDRLRRLSYIPDIYRKYSLESWVKAATDTEMRGKELALAIAHYYVDSFGRSFHLHQALDDLGVPYEVIEPNFASMNKRDHKYRLVIQQGDQNIILPDSTGNSLGFIGNFGLGKSGMAAGIANALIERGVYVRFIRLSDFIQSIQNTYDSEYEGPSVPDIVKPLAECDLLIVDEFGVTGEKASPDKAKIVQDYVINPRWNKNPMRPIIFTTNHTDQTFYDQWDGQIATRVFEMAHVIEFVGMPLRQDNR
jgi:DNA replication protein DnaC